MAYLQIIFAKNKIMDKKTAKKKIEDGIVGRKVLELSCIADDNDRRDFTVIPLCIKEHGGGNSTL